MTEALGAVHFKQALPAVLELAPGAAHRSRLSAVETVRARIILAIEHGLLQPGNKLPALEEIAQGLEVSIITARRGLESLVTDGYLLRKRGRGGGTFVADPPPSAKDTAVAAFRADNAAINSLIDQRSLMESAIVHAAALNATPADCELLEKFIADSAAAPGWIEHAKPDMAFHRHIAKISGLPETDTYLAVYTALHNYFVPYPQEQLEHGLDEHRQIVAALKKHDPVAAVAVARKHIDALRHEMFIAL
ncbi:FadR/GntR family transcriptional regulator [Canibacter zhoujuaniae]|uniref:FadR/GntR family transcriptional regulator n=1 Tax=Canibacter zhoujuaniae TaxID=2708343 RepID=UPI00141E9EED|nr:FCD domain-containing protein [Canibacter zhoujuaniae]